MLSHPRELGFFLFIIIIILRKSFQQEKKKTLIARGMERIFFGKIIVVLTGLKSL